MGLRHGPCTIPISSINTDKIFMAFPSSKQRRHRFAGISRVIRNTAEPPRDFISSSVPLSSQRTFIPYSRQAILYHQRDGTSKGQSHHAHTGAINKHRHKNQCSALHPFQLHAHTDPRYPTHPLRPTLQIETVTSQ